VLERSALATFRPYLQKEQDVTSLLRYSKISEMIILALCDTACLLILVYWEYISHALNELDVTNWFHTVKSCISVIVKLLSL